MRLKATERELIDPGFRRSWQPPEKADESPIIPTGTGRLASLKKGERITPRQVSVRQVVTLPPAICEATLVRAMQASGIGRPSTYAATIETLVSRGYAARSKNGELRSTERGRAVLAFLVERFPGLFEPAYTARMETCLDEIACGQAAYLDTLSRFWQELQALLPGKPDTP